MLYIIKIESIVGKMSEMLMLNQWFNGSFARAKLINGNLSGCVALCIKQRDDAYLKILLSDHFNTRAHKLMSDKVLLESLLRYSNDIVEAFVRYKNNIYITYNM